MKFIHSFTWLKPLNLGVSKSTWTHLTHFNFEKKKKPYEKFHFPNIIRTSHKNGNAQCF